jgi:hypothetical protein
MAVRVAEGAAASARGAHSHPEPRGWQTSGNGLPSRSGRRAERGSLDETEHEREKVMNL